MKNLLLALTLLSFIGSSAQTKSGKFSMPKRQMIGKSILNLKGDGVREKMWLDMYKCGLYLKTNEDDAKVIINKDEAMAIKIHIVSSLITSKKMTDAVEEGFKNSLNGKTKALRNEIDQFKAVFSKEEIKEEDTYDIIYVPGKGTVIFKNNKIQPIIKGLEFKKALFGIWLGDKPADKDLKEALLGKS